MNSFCPCCDMPMRNPKACDCGWVMPHEIKVKLFDERTERNKEMAKRFVEYAHSLNKGKADE